jgi:hypothetical protein
MSFYVYLLQKSLAFKDYILDKSSKVNPFITACLCQATILLSIYCWLSYDYVLLLLGVILLLFSMALNTWLFSKLSFISLLHVLYLNVLRSGVYFSVYALMGVLAQESLFGILLGAMHLGLELGYSKLANLQVIRDVGSRVSVPAYVYKYFWMLLLVGVGGLWHSSDLFIFAQMWLVGAFFMFLYGACDWALTARDVLKSSTN